MQQKNPQADAILKAIQEREKDHLLQLGISNKLAQVTDIKALTAVVQQELKDVTLSDHTALCITDADEKHYKLFFHDDSKVLAEHKNQEYSTADGIFDAALQSAEPLIIKATDFSKKKTTPAFIEKAFAIGIREIVVLPLYHQKNNPTVLFLFYKKPGSFGRQALRLLKGISLQLSLTVCNILLTQKIALYGNTPPATSTEDLVEDTPVQVSENESFSGIVGQGIIMQQVITLIKQVAPSTSGVLLLGESGTGKEVIAHAVHYNSAVRHKEMVRVNCAAIPANLIESELFGHEKGSFTGATERRIGKFEQANNSTLFLDEIGELPLALQTKLLRVLQESEFERIGSAKTIKVNVRIIAATNLNLEQEVAAGRFRADLYYRLNVFPITIPPLRERREDIPELSAYFVSAFCAANKRKVLTISAKVLNAMAIYPWPGNVRELKHVLERSVLLATGHAITEIYLPEIATGSTNEDAPQRIKLLEEVEKEYILKVIKLCNGRISGPNGAANKLGIPNTTLISKMQKLGIKKSHSIKQEKP
nr:sigma 54-interacting transcriptional regulator [uncultured Flavobacterium sp.]